MLADINVGVIGTGFMGVAHTEALRRLGVNVIGVVGSSPARARAKAAVANLPRVYDSVEELLREPALRVVHVTSPNDVHADQVRTALAAGKHVLCEKPLGVSTEETRDLLTRAEASGRVHAICFNVRFFPQNQNAAGMVRDGAIGVPRFVTGRYHQDWLLLDTDWNWRLDASRQGALRAVADIGSHWLDLVGFITGRRIQSVCADLHTFITERQRPVGEVETFATVAPDVERVREPMSSDDAAGILLRFEGGGAACAPSARSPPAARTASSGRSTAPMPRWRGRWRHPNSSGSVIAADPTSCSTRTRR